MGLVIFDTAATLNGFLADEHGSLDWLFRAPDPEGLTSELVPDGATVLVEGSTTYEWVLSHEDLLAHPEKWGEFYGAKPTFVFTSRALPVPLGADVRFVSGSVTEVFPEIRSAAGEGDIWVVGGGDLAGQFIDAGLMDQVAVSIAPATVAAGAPLLPRTVGSDRLALVSARAVGQFARLVYSITRE